MWDKGKGRITRVAATEHGHDRMVLFKRPDNGFAQVSVHERSAFDPWTRTFDYNDAAELADEEFRRNLRDQFLAELE
jgi:hypothetical protein